MDSGQLFEREGFGANVFSDGDGHKSRSYLLFRKPAAQIIEQRLSLLREGLLTEM
jgi:hypothetical protein